LAEVGKKAGTCLNHAHRALILAPLGPGTGRIVGLSDARTQRFEEGTNEIQETIIARKLLGGPSA
jgi:alkylation response protein AidB-like acyl-CoA dehydrogenase